MRAASAAAHGALAVARHLHQFHARQGTHELTRRFVDAVVAAQEAGVVVGDFQGDACLCRLCRGAVPGVGVRLAGRGGAGSDRREQAVAHESIEELRVVDDVEAAAQLRVLPGDRVKAMRAGNDDRARLCFVQGVDRLGGKHLEEGLVSGSARRVARA